MNGKLVNAAKQLGSEAAKNKEAKKHSDKLNNENSYTSMHPSFYTSKIGFTLAEVLITLGVIGVVAAITMPTVIKDYQQQVTVNKLKKVYTILNQAFKMSEIDNGAFENWAWTNRTEYVRKYWQPYIKISRTCIKWKDCKYSSKLPWYNTNKTNAVRMDVTDYNLITIDGMLLMFIDTSIIIVDLNTYAGPNQWGKDLFRFNVSDKGVFPAAYNYVNLHSAYCQNIRNGADNGEYCAGKIMYDGWQIKDDYPW